MLNTTRLLLPLILVGALWTGAPIQAATPLAYGPDTCKQGFVFREAYPNDYVCVTTAERKTVRMDNLAAASRLQPAGNAGGAAACKSGWVPREARPQDRVCVSGAQHEQAALDNRLAYSRQQARLSEPRKTPSKPHAPIFAIGPHGERLKDANDIKGCHLGGAKCPLRMQVAYDVNVGCVCAE